METLVPLELVVVAGGDADDVCEFCFDAMLTFVDTFLLPPPCVQVVVELFFLLTSDDFAVVEQVVLVSFNMNVIQQKNYDLLRKTAI